MALPRSRPASGQSAYLPERELIPYLPIVGAPPLRFQEVTPPADLVTRPAAAAPPVPALSLTESSVALANAAAAHSAAMATRAPEETPAATVKPESKVTEAPAAPAKGAPAILPDDARPQVHPEDFLPYFQIPGATRQPGDVTPVAPAPAPLPPSSATYTQSK